MTFDRDFGGYLQKAGFVPGEVTEGLHCWVHQNLWVYLVSLEVKHPPHFQLKLLQQYPDRHVVFVWEDRWQHQKDIILSRLESYLGRSEKVHGRQAKVIGLNKPHARVFLEEHHMLGYAPGKYNYGLLLRDELVAVAVFGREIMIQRDFGPSQSHELMRFCYKKHLHVRGGLSKLIQAFIRDIQPGDIYTAVDREWSQGQGFLNLGFKIMGISDPLPFWIDKLGLRYRTEKPDCLMVYNAGNVKLLYTS